jgi:hypothetical protein
MFRDSRLNRLPLVLLLLLPVLNGCAVSKPHAELPPDIAKQRIGELQLAILALGDGVDTDESLRAAKIAFEYSKQLARKYEVTFVSTGLAIYWRGSSGKIFTASTCTGRSPTTRPLSGSSTARLSSAPADIRCTRG